MTLESVATVGLAVVTLAGLIVGGFWAVLKPLMKEGKDRAAKDQEAIWKQIEELRRDLVDAQRQLQDLKTRAELQPDWDSRISALEEKLENKLEGISQQLQSLTKFRCPMAEREGL